ncbi:MAG: hemolysin family protein [Bryobacteraceae bacterium]
MDLPIGYRFLLVGLIIVINAFLAAAEASLLSVRQSRLKHMADEGNSGAKAALDLLANPEKFLSVMQLGLTCAGLGLGWAGEETLKEFLFHILHFQVPEPWHGVLAGICFAVAFVIVSYLHIVFGEVVPKNLAIEKADRIAVLLAPPILFFAHVAGPFVNVIERSAAAISRVLGLRGDSHAAGHSAEELKFIISAAHKHAQLESFEEGSLLRILELRDLATREIMTPRNSVVSAPADSSLDDLLRLFHENKYSRLPIYERGKEHLVGIVYAKDLLDVWQQRRYSRENRLPSPRFELKRLLRQPPVVPETKPVTQLIDMFRHSGSHMAFVVDEFGSVTGVVTLEDSLEQVFGEIEDEHDVKLPPLPLDWDELDLEGSTTIRDLEKHYLIELPTNAGFETLAGFILFRLGVIPKTGDRVVEGMLAFEVAEMDRNRIVRVRVVRAEPVAEN